MYKYFHVNKCYVQTYLHTIFTVPYLLVTSENLVIYLLTLHRGLQNIPCQFNFQFLLLILQYWKWNCFDVVAKEKISEKNTFISAIQLYEKEEFLSMNHYFSFANCLLFISFFVVLFKPDQTEMDGHYICSSGKRQLWKQGFLTVTMSK